MTVLDYLVGLQASFDSQALRPPVAAQGERARIKSQALAAQALTAWCLAGAVPKPRLRLAVGALRGTMGTEALALMAWTDAFARQLDGGIRLDALPTHAAGLAWRVQAKLNDARPWRQRLPRHPPCLDGDARSHCQRQPTSTYLFGPRRRPGPLLKITPSHDNRRCSMLKWAIIFAVISLLAGVFGFTGVASGAAGIAKILFFIFIAITVVFLVIALLGVGAVA